MSILHCTNAVTRRYPVRQKAFYKQEFYMIVSHIIARIRAHLRYRASVRALSHLSERELADIGLSRGDIEVVARTAATA
jgi:uncharacterized protein YjiS (DUF1127 family)